MYSISDISIHFNIYYLDIEVICSSFGRNKCLFMEEKTLILLNEFNLITQICIFYIIISVLGYQKAQKCINMLIIG